MKKNITDEEYTEVKKLFKIMKMKTLDDLNQIYKFQCVAVLCEIFEKRATQLQNYLNIILENVIAQAVLQVVFKDFKVNV